MISKNNYLDMMGIQRWRATYLLPGALDTIAATTWILLNKQTQELSAVLRVESVPSDFEQAEIDKLLDAMLAAVQLKRDVLVGDSAPPPNLLQIIMGDRLAQKILDTAESLETLRANNTERLKGNTPVLVTYHPEKLLADGKLKRKAWEDLKVLIDPS